VGTVLGEDLEGADHLLGRGEDDGDIIQEDEAGDEKTEEVDSNIVLEQEVRKVIEECREQEGTVRRSLGNASEKFEEFK
jgi:hypothetical protein